MELRFQRDPFMCPRKLFHTDMYEYVFSLVPESSDLMQELFIGDREPYTEPVFQWCVEQFGPQGFLGHSNERWDCVALCWGFKNAEDATLFRIRWC